MQRDPGAWWREGVLYQTYPRSFADSNGDGVGDLRGLIGRLDYLSWLGIDGIWLNPVMDSPNEDWGYDVSNYKRVHPEMGDLADVDELVAQASARDIAVVFDLVPNHTSDRHAWFRDALTARSARHRDWYVWADPAPDGSPPNNWISVFGGEPAWEYHEPTGQYYLHNFLKEQPDLDWWNDEVRDAFDDILRFWFDRGIAGFRIDVAHAIIKDRELRDNLPAAEDDHERVRRLGQRAEYNMNRPEVHEIHRRWRKLCDEYETRRVLIGETFVMDLEQMVRYYGDGNDELHLAFNFPFALAELDGDKLRTIVETSDRLIPPQGWPVWMGSNHDIRRFPTRWCNGDEARIRCVLMMLLCIRGTPFLYNGDEIGMQDVYVPAERILDPVGRRGGRAREGRDPCRTPMQWEPRPGAGFTEPGVEPWLPFGNYEGCNVADQRDDPLSILNLCRDLIQLRRRTPDLRIGAYTPLGDGVAPWAWRRGGRIALALNMSDDDVRVDGVAGTVAISTGRDRDGDRVADGAPLAPWEGLVVELG